MTVLASDTRTRDRYSGAEVGATDSENDSWGNLEHHAGLLVRSGLLVFTVPGVPVPCARPRVVKGHAYTPAKTAGYQRRVGVSARVAVAGREWPMTDRYVVSVLVYRGANRGDLDNFIKNIDGLKGILWDDDRRVVGLRGWNLLSRTDPRLEIRVEAWR